MKRSDIQILLLFLITVGIITIQQNVLAQKIEIRHSPSKVIIPWGAYSPECTKTNSCYQPNRISVNFGDKVIWENFDVTYHTVTSGTPENGPDGVFESGLFGRHDTFEFTFSDFRTQTFHHYYCRIHPWMTGVVALGVEIPQIN